MGKWIKYRDAIYNNSPLVVHEVKCPVCGYRETFHVNPPHECYVCGERLEYTEGDSNDGENNKM